jgi:hypothetical protein
MLSGRLLRVEAVPPKVLDQERLRIVADNAARYHPPLQRLEARLVDGVGLALVSPYAKKGTVRDAVEVAWDDEEHRIHKPKLRMRTPHVHVLIESVQVFWPRYRVTVETDAGMEYLLIYDVDRLFRQTHALFMCNRTVGKFVADVDVDAWRGYAAVATVRVERYDKDADDVVLEEEVHTVPRLMLQKLHLPPRLPPMPHPRGELYVPAKDIVPLLPTLQVFHGTGAPRLPDGSRLRLTDDGFLEQQVCGCLWMSVWWETALKPAPRYDEEGAGAE